MQAEPDWFCLPLRRILWCVDKQFYANLCSLIKLHPFTLLIGLPHHSLISTLPAYLANNLVLSIGVCVQGCRSQRSQDHSPHRRLLQIYLFFSHSNFITLSSPKSQYPSRFFPFSSLRRTSSSNSPPDAATSHELSDASSASPNPPIQDLPCKCQKHQ